MTRQVSHGISWPKEKLPRLIRFGCGWLDFTLPSSTVHTAYKTQEGVSDALKHRYLASFQITFHNGDVSRDTIAVAYMMKFNYSENGGKIQFDVSSGNQTVEFTAEDMQDLKNTFQRLMKISQETDKIPGMP